MVLRLSRLIGKTFLIILQSLVIYECPKHKKQPENALSSHFENVLRKFYMIILTPEVPCQNRGHNDLS
jgi:hypothetical protein